MLGIFVLLFMASFTTYDACEFANNNSIYIKDETRLAYEADDIELVKYHAYKALTGIERSKNNFKNCGCDAAVESINRTKINLKNATKTSSIYDAKEFIDIALKNTALSISELEKYNNASDTDYGVDFLTLNIKDTVINDDIVKLKGKTLSDKIDNGVAKFKESLDRMISVNDCAAALAYIQKTNELSTKKQKTKQFHQENVITMNA